MPPPTTAATSNTTWTERLSGGAGAHVRDHPAGVGHVLGGQRRVDQEHQAGRPERPRHRSGVAPAPGRARRTRAPGRSPSRIRRSRHPAVGDRGHDAIAGPAARQPLRSDEGVELVPGVADVSPAVSGTRSSRDRPQASARIAALRRRAASHSGRRSQLAAADRRLHLGHAPVGAEGLVQPAEARRVLAVIDRVVALAVVLVRPGARATAPRRRWSACRLRRRW